jgi:hypothetical protein
MAENKIIFDLKTAALFGPSCKFTELVESYLTQGFGIELWRKNWSAGDTHKGTTFDKKTGEYKTSSGDYLWDPNTHPEDYFVNLVDASFENISYIDKKYSKWSLIHFLFKRNYISYPIALCFLGDRAERKRYFRQKLKEIYLNNPGLKSFIVYLYFFLETRIFIHLKIKPKSFYGLRYKLSDKMNNFTVNKFIKQNQNKKYILISVLWDEGKRFEVMDDRLKGGPIFMNSHGTNFVKLVEYIKELDSIISKNNDYSFLLASKKAVDWGNLLKTEFLDLRNFEKYGFSLSQMIYICQELSVATINWPSTFSIWITPCKDIMHLTWNDNKDTARWTRNTLHLQSPQALIDLLDKKYANSLS